MKLSTLDEDRITSYNVCYTKLLRCNAEDIRSNFSDHELILGLGLESVMNVPVRILGRTIGTMNLLHHADYYDVADLECGYFLAGQLVGPLCMAKSTGSRTG